MSPILVGSLAVAAGSVTKYDLRARYERVLPDIYVPRGFTPALSDRVEATWLWSQRQGIVSGWAASALHGAKWVPDDAPIEIIWPGRKGLAGVIVRRDTLLAEEVTIRNGMPVTTVARTAFDLARHGSAGRAIERLDALAAATDFKSDEVLAVASRHPHVKGLRRVPDLLDRSDAGAQSPKETWLRLLLIEAGFPRPRTQIPVGRPDGYRYYYLDMGWQELMVAVEYDGGHHFADPVQVRSDIERLETLAAMGWIVIRVVAGDRAMSIVRRVQDAWALRAQ
jgi:very-short-patch-repair endonuclease